MKALDKDLRVRVVKAREAGESIAEVAERFAVSLSSGVLNKAAPTGPVRKRLHRGVRERGTIEGQSPPGRPAYFQAHTLEAFRLQLDAHNDWTLEQHQQAWYATTGVRVSVSTVYRVCQKLNWTLKKKPNAR